MKALLLGRGGRILGVIGWKCAVMLAHFRQVAFVLDWHDKYVYSQRDKFKMPSVMMLFDKKDKNPCGDTLPLNKHNIFIRDNWTCQYCGKTISTTSGTVDHVYPTSRGGTHTWRNVVTACKKCNCLKDNMTAEEFYDAYGVELMSKPRVPSRVVLFKNYLENPEYKNWSQFIRN